MVAPPACEPGKDTFVNCAASSPLSAGSAAAFGSAFTRCHGSRLFTLRLRSRHKPAVLFSTSPAMRKSLTGLAKATCPSRCKRSLYLAFRRHWLADLRLRRPPESLTPCWYAVATYLPLRQLRFVRVRNQLELINPAVNGFSSFLAAQFLLSRFQPRATTTGGTGESCLDSQSLHSDKPRDRANQPDPIFPQSPGIILLIWDSSSFLNVLSMNQPQDIRNVFFGKKIICTVCSLHVTSARGLDTCLNQCT